MDILARLMLSLYFLWVYGSNTKEIPWVLCCSMFIYELYWTFVRAETNFPSCSWTIACFNSSFNTFCKLQLHDKDVTRIAISAIKINKRSFWRPKWEIYKWYIEQQLSFYNMFWKIKFIFWCSIFIVSPKIQVLV